MPRVTEVLAVRTETEFKSNFHFLHHNAAFPCGHALLFASLSAYHSVD